MNYKEELRKIFEEDKDYYPTSDFLRSNHSNIPEEVIIRNDPSFFLFLGGLMVVVAIVNKFFYFNEFGFHIASGMFILFVILLLNRSPKVIINKKGIFLNGYGNFNWKNIENTYIRVVSGDSPSWYIVIQSNAKTIEFYYYGLDKQIDEAAHYIESFRIKFGNNSLSYRLTR